MTQEGSQKRVPSKLHLRTNLGPAFPRPRTRNAGVRMAGWRWGQMGAGEGGCGWTGTVGSGCRAEAGWRRAIPAQRRGSSHNALPGFRLSVTQSSEPPACRREMAWRPWLYLLQAPQGLSPGIWPTGLTPPLPGSAGAGPLPCKHRHSHPRRFLPRPLSPAVPRPKGACCWQLSSFSPRVLTEHLLCARPGGAAQKSASMGGWRRSVISVARERPWHHQHLPEPELLLPLPGSGASTLLPTWQL